MSYLQSAQLLSLHEWVALLAFGLLAIGLPAGWCRRHAQTVSRIYRRLLPSQSPLLGAVLVAATIAFAVDFVFAVAVRLPEANYHDEFSYLLAGDTFARGRLSNPPPPSPPHFESFHILVSPTYQSKYPPGQGLFLAAGQLAGFAGLGVWMSHAFASGATCWCLGQFIVPRWALLGALLLTLHDRALIWWGQTYWGGAVAAFAGALLFGGFGWWLRAKTPWSGLVMGWGAGWLALSRPAEGVLCCVLVLLGIAISCLREPDRKRTLSLLGAGLIGVIPFLFFLGLHNQAITGHALTFPYRAWTHQYAIGLSGAQGVGSEAHELTPFGQFQHDFFASQSYRFTPSFAAWKFAFRLRPFYLPSLTLLSLAGITVPASLGGRILASAALAVLLFVIANPAGGFPHYAAPVAAPITLGIVCGLRRASQRMGRKRGDLAAVALIATLAIGVVRLFLVWPAVPAIGGASLESGRQEIADSLAAGGGGALVFVRYGTGHLAAAEYVYNGAEVRAASDAGGPPVVWVRALDPVRDRRLRDLYPRRQAFLLNLDERGGQLVEFEAFARNNPSYTFPPAGSDLP